WREVGRGYDDVNEFLADIRLDQFRIVAEQRKRIVERIRELQPEVSNRTIAKVVGVDEITVRRDTATNVAPDLKISNENKDGNSEWATNAAPAGTSPVRGTQGTGENEWFTPTEYIEAARKVLGEIDLDPATHELAQQTIRAARFFTKADNGLEHEWHGR